MGPLTFFQMRQLVDAGHASSFNFVDVQQAVVEFLLQRSSGNPFVALELLQELLDGHRRGASAAPPSPSCASQSY